MNLLLDTTVLVDVLRRRNDRQSRLAELVEMGYVLSMSGMNIAEIYAGMRPGEEDRTMTFLARLACYAITPEIAVRAGDWKCQWSKNGITLSLPDMLIASTAVQHGLTLMTDNRKHFPMANIKFFSSLG